MPLRLNLNSCLFFLFAALLALATGTSARAESVTLRLRDGDRITGTIVSETTNAVVISTRWAKELSIPASEIIGREKAVETLAVIKTNQPPTATLGKVEATSASVAGTVPPTPPLVTKEPAESKIKARKSWHGRIDIGTDLGFSETSRQLYYGKAKITYIPEMLPGEIATVASRFRNTFEYQVTYGKSDDVLSANRMDASSKTDFDIGKRVFVYNLIGVGYDEIRKINYQYEVGPGFGYRLFTKTNFILNTELGLTYQVQELERSTGGIEMNERFFMRVAEEAKWTITKRLSLDEKLEFFPGIDDIGAFRIRFESNLRYAFWENLSLSLTVMDVYDNQPASGVGQNDLQIRSTLGINF